MPVRHRCYHEIDPSSRKPKDSTQALKIVSGILDTPIKISEMNRTILFALRDSMHNQIPTVFATLFAGFVLYILICSALRFKGRDALLKRYHYPTMESLSNMTIDVAQDISQFLYEYEFPYMYLTSLQFALFKTYGIPTISKILVETKQLSMPRYSSKRYADTLVIVDEIMGHPPSNDRAIKSMARLNYLHGQYPQIPNSDFLYTLAVILLEPVKWINKYEWRKLTPTEVCALSTFWKDVGDRMNIKYDELKRFKSGWNNGLDFYEDIVEWTARYERQHMVPAKSNKQLAEETVALLLWYVPHVLRPYGKKALVVVMEERVREAMSLDAPTPFYKTVVFSILEARRLFLRYLSLPRPEFFRKRTISDTSDPKTGRFHYKDYQAHPFYVKPTFWNRWGPAAFLVRICGGTVPGSNGNTYVPQGYLFEEVGPARMKGKGLDEMDSFEVKLRSAKSVTGCPFGKF